MEKLHLTGNDDGDDDPPTIHENYLFHPIGMIYRVMTYKVMMVRLANTGCNPTAAVLQIDSVLLHTCCMVVNFLLFCFISAYVNLMRVTFGEIKYLLLLISKTISVQLCASWQLLR